MLANWCSTFPSSISKCMQVVQLQRSNCSRPKLVFSPHLTPLWRWNKATTYGKRCHPFVTVHFNLSQFCHERVSYQINPQNFFRSLIYKMRVNVIKLFLPDCVLKIHHCGISLPHLVKRPRTKPLGEFPSSSPSQGPSPLRATSSHSSHQVIWCKPSYWAPVVVTKAYFFPPVVWNASFRWFPLSLLLQDINVALLKLHWQLASASTPSPST